MRRVLIQSYYKLVLTPKEMGKLKKLRGLGKVAEKITVIKEVRGVMFSADSIEVNIEAGRHRVDEVLETVASIVEDELI